MKTVKLPPGNLGLPVVGETLELLNPDFFIKRFNKYGPIFKSNVLGTNTIFVSGADGINFVFANENKFFISNLPDSTKRLMGAKSLSTQVGEEHKCRRRTIQKGFSPQLIESHKSKIEEITHYYFQKWECLQTFQWYPELRKYTFDVACSFIMGFERASEHELFDLFKTWSDGLFSIPLNLKWSKFGKAYNSRHKILSYLEEFIQNQQYSKKNQLSVLEILLAEHDHQGKKLGTDEISQQLAMLIFTGHETLTSSLSSLCLMLMENPEILQKCRNEESNTKNNKGQISTLQKVIFEVLRVLPPVGSGFKKIIKTCEFNDFLFPEGWNLQYLINLTQKNEKIYRDSSQFNIDRFNLDEMNKVSRSFDYIPFGGGLRECIGKDFAVNEMMIFASHLIKNNNWNISPTQDFTMSIIPVPIPKDGLIVTFSNCS